MDLSSFSLPGPGLGVLVAGYSGDANTPRRLDPIRQIPDGVEHKLHLLARRLVLPHPRGGTLDVTAPLPPHMQKSFDMFGFDVKGRDPIEEAPE